MKLLDRKVAAILMVVMMVVATLFGSHRSLSALSKKAEQVFYNGVSGDGLCIQNDLTNRAEQAYNLTTVAKRYLSASDPTVAKVLDAWAQMSSANTIGRKYQANQALTTATTELYELLLPMELSESDGRYLRSIYTDLGSRNDTISHDPYNQLASAFNAELDGFPAKLLGSLTGIHPLELFR